MQLLAPEISRDSRPRPESYEFDLDQALDAVLSLRSEIPEDAYTASILGTEREGHGVLIGDDGLVLTIGYLIAEADMVTLADNKGKVSYANLVGYDYDTGFGLVRATEALGVAPIQVGDSESLGVGEQIVVGGHGGQRQSMVAQVVSRREFAGYWEYLLDEAIFTAPPHPNWGGTALIGKDGRLCGIGSLYVQDALPGENAIRGNMFVPIDLLKPIMSDLLLMGRVNRPARPWLGMFTTEMEGHLVVAGLASNGPAQRVGISVGDLVVRVAGRPVATLAEMLRRVWSLGDAGVDVQLTVQREERLLETVIHSGNRYEFMKSPSQH
ncbi:MAG: S1C family serine protease [Alphaproteobacteria bacterium]|nr:S1C family serine protease [Alphaproteobacteria bacterium]